ncbi:MAG: TlpA family protein disulfide reductase [Sulfurovum sp.]|nr:TlpA family protein disulfide reductase [Sulfurovum sp.]
MKKLLLSTLLLLGFMSHAQAEAAAKKSSLEITDINGKTYTVTGTPEGLKISGTKGKVVFIEFFGHECPPCLMSIPHLIKMKEKYKDKLEIFAIEVQKLPKDALKNFIKDIRPLSKKYLTFFAYRNGINLNTLLAPAQQHHTINYPVFSTLDSDNNYFVNYIGQRAQWKGSIPFMVVLDTTGEVQFIQAGMLPESSLEDLFRQYSKK